MAEIIQKKVPHCVTSYLFEFRCPDQSYYSFPCKEDGSILFEEMSELAKQNYRDCVDRKLDVVFAGIRKHVQSWIDPAILRCDCGAKVELADFTNTCDRCGADYNFAGQRLAPREQWGEETGEHWTECY